MLKVSRHSSLKVTAGPGAWRVSAKREAAARLRIGKTALYEALAAARAR